MGVGVQDDKEGKLKAVEQVEAAVQKLEAKGIPRSRIVVGGFSQGGAIALLSAYYHGNRPPFGACVTLSGWLTLTQELNMKHATSTPVFWGHGKYDDKVLFEQQAHGVKILKEAGVKVQDREYPIGHESDPQELEDMAQFLVDCLFGNGEDGGGGGGSSSEL